MKKSNNYLEKIEKNLSKREFHIKFNYMKNQEISNLLEKFEKEKEKFEINSRYSNIEEIKNFKIYQIEDIEILDLEKKYIIIRKDEKSFFYNIFIQEEYRNYNKENQISILEYIEKISNFISINNLKYILLDIEKDYLLKKEEK